MIWRGWAGLCLIAGSVVAPLFLEVFSGGSGVRFLALPLRWGWFGLLGLTIVRDGWVSCRIASAALVSVTLPVSAATLIDLATSVTLHPGWFLALEWWQRALYPWLDLLPLGTVLDRPAYLWLACGWTIVESILVVGVLLRTSTTRAAPEGPAVDAG